MADQTNTTSLEGADDLPNDYNRDGSDVIDATLNSPVVPTAHLSVPIKQKKSSISRLTIPILILAMLGLPAATIFAAFQNTKPMSLAQENAFASQQIDLNSLDLPVSTASQDAPGTLTVNGQLSVAGSLQVNPGAKPANPKAGQIYYDKASHNLGYYNGANFVYLQGGGASSTTNVTNVAEVTNTTVINNYSTAVPPDDDPDAVLLQGDTPGTVQTGNFNIDGAGVMGIASIGTGNIETINGTTGNIATVNATDLNGTTGIITTVNSDTLNGTTGNIATINSDSGNISILNSDTATVTGATTLNGATTVNGAALFNNTLTTQADSSNALQVKDAADNTLLNVNTTNNDIAIGSGNSTFAINGSGSSSPAGTNVNLGITNVLSDNTSYRTGTGRLAMKFTTGIAGGTLQSLSTYILLNSGYTFYLGLYADNGNSPNSLPTTLLTSASGTSVTGWNTLSVSPVTLQPYTSYWIVMALPRQIVIPQGGSSSTVCLTSGSLSLPTNFGTSCSSYNFGFSFYATYLTDPAGADAGNAMFSISDTGQATFRSTIDSTHAFRIQDATNGATLFNLDSVTGNIAIGKSSASYKLDIDHGDINLTSGQSLRFGGTNVLSATTTSTTLAGTAITLQGATTMSSTAAIQGAATFASSVSVTGAATFSSTATVSGALTATNTVTNKVNSVTAFRIQNTSLANLFVADTTNMIITIAGSDTSYASLTLTDAHFKSTQTTPPTIAAPTNCGAGATAAVAAGSTDTAGSFTITTGTDGTSSTCDATITFQQPYGAAPKSIIIVGKGNGAAVDREIYVTSEATTGFNITFNKSAAGADSTVYEFNYWVIE
ncbi:hypothetical protein ORI20_30775 [Mycobacterium sp. CVI_P3]|uniref:Uncharacterized protein n=1 Tax=Mycobacterium pinniadriaticum TaxID=2994102 RepID=A0ABT3SQB0_9MYCO|nr:hypothetical protein [Mycobacterium pinniadriaticum]MCX2934657.1 hypothetical protein [Mycobacterium pinniadriaticum]MCX2941080.1 hypothetical protein [Mycobacterium pinniadriaticum]